MAAYHRVYDSRRLLADCQEPGSGNLRSVIEYGLPFYIIIIIFLIPQVVKVPGVKN